MGTGLSRSLGVCLAHRIKIRMVHRFPCRQPRLVVVLQQLVQKVNRLRHSQVLVVVVNKLLPWLLGVSKKRNALSHLCQLVSNYNSCYLPIIDLK